MIQKNFFKLLNINSCGKKQSNLIFLQVRQINLFLEILHTIFNRVNKERVRLVGPECACAEWLLRNGASVRFKGYPTLLSDYNELIALERTEAKILKIEEIYAKEAALNHVGFDHLSGCSHVKKMSFIFCSHLTDSALFKFKYVQGTLEYLELTSCFNIKDKGLNSICDLRNLKTLVLADLVSVRDKVKCEEALKKALPQCKIDFQN